MPVSGGGLEQCYNAQAGVDADTMLVVATTLTQAPNDKQQVEPILKVLQGQTTKLGSATALIADTGYCSDNNVKACVDAQMEPLLSLARQDHHPHWRERFTEPAPLVEDATPMQSMVHRLSTIAGKAAYAIRKQSASASVPPATASNTPSTTHTWKCTCSFRLEPNRWMKATAPMCSAALSTCAAPGLAVGAPRSLRALRAADCTPWWARLR